MSELTGLEIAVIGMSGRFPGASNLNQFWENLKNGVESISFFTDEELIASGVSPKLLKNPNYVKAKGVLQEIEYFDASFFDYSPKEARLMDPQVRLFHECSWEALEDAGYDPVRFSGLIGLYAGGELSLNWVARLLGVMKTPAERFEIGNLNTSYALSTRISHKFNLKGPSCIIQTACSTSLVATHFAIQGLLSGECDLALAGGVSIILPQKNGYVYQEGMVNSPDGHCRAFDAKAKGTNGGDGIGVVLLKRLEDALEDGDHIYAVIKGSAINNDGSRKMGYTAPSTIGQMEVIRAAHQVAEVEAESISYIEAHGTGTTLGDPIEIEALRKAFNTTKKRFCPIGSVKTNVGHLDNAAGVASLIKTVLALQHRQIPPSLHFTKPNPVIDFENSPFYVNTDLQNWENYEYPLRAGVSSFGIGGTNAHVVLEEAPLVEAGSTGRDWKLIMLSAKTPTALKTARENLGNFLQNNSGLSLADVAYTLQVGRRAFKHKQVLLTSSLEEVTAQLLAGDEGKKVYSSASEEPRPLIFMFSGQGSQYINMGLDLYQNEPTFCEIVDECLEILDSLVDYDLKQILYPDEAFTEKAKELINQQDISQPIIYIFEYALAKLIMHWGVKPHAMIGYSIGEYVAATLAEVISVEDALRLLVLRGDLMRNLPTGLMLSVPLSEAELTPLLNEEISLAVVNGPSCIVSGSYEAIEAFEEKMKAEKILCMRLSITHAGHSKMMDSILGDYEQAVQQISLEKPKIPYVSTATGRWITVEEATDPEYWANHIRATVRFADGLQELLKIEDAVFLEIGPGRDLAVLVKRYITERPNERIMNLVRHPQREESDQAYLLQRLGRLWTYGVEIDWTAFYDNERRCRVSLPTYPFERQYYWVEQVNEIDLFQMDQLQDLASFGTVETVEKAMMNDWFYRPSWQQSKLETKDLEEELTGDWLVFTNESNFNLQLIQGLGEDHQVILVYSGQEFRKLSSTEYVINPSERGMYTRLIEEISQDRPLPENLLHLWNHDLCVVDDLAGVDEILNLGFYSLLYLAQALNQAQFRDQIQLVIVTNDREPITGMEVLSPLKALVLGPCKVLGQEYPGIHCRSIDTTIPKQGSWLERWLITQLVTEIRHQSANQLVAYRGQERYLKAYEKVESVPKAPIIELREQGVYLLTGGLGGIGLVIADYLAKHYQARVILTGRSAFPHKDSWEQWLACHHEHDLFSTKIRQLQQMESEGGEVLVLTADVTESSEMERVKETINSTYGILHGIIHCAGNPGNGMIQRKTREEAEKVLGPKVKGTLVLEVVFGDMDLDFMVLSSSFNSILPLFGQVDYCAANAFLDVFAYRNNAVNGHYTVSVNWDSWQEVGKTAEMVQEFDQRFIKANYTKGFNHPLIQEAYDGQKGERIYVAQLNPEKHWVLADHRINGQATMPGTGSLELVRAAFALHTHSMNCVFQDVYFMAPLSVADDETREVRIRFSEQADGYEFSVKSLSLSDDWDEHVRGQIRQLSIDHEAVSVKVYSLRTLSEACQLKKIDYTVIKADLIAEMEKVGLQFGPRWDTIQQILIGEDEGLAYLKLNEEFIADTNTYLLHPALLDAATSFLGSEVREEGVYLPITYKQIKVYGSLVDKVISYSRYLPDNRERKETLKFDICIMNESGQVLVEIEEYTIRKVDTSYSSLNESQIQQGIMAQVAVTSEKQEPQQNIYAEELARYGIKPAEGVEVFKIALESGLPQLIISTQDLEKRIARNKALQESHFGDLLGNIKNTGKLDIRPELSSEYIPPNTEIERQLIAIWQEFFGIEEIGIEDDFFELGGDSLKAITVVSMIHQRMEVEIPLSEIFNLPTASALAEYIGSSEITAHLSIEPAEQKEYYQLSSAQKRMYVLQQLDPDNVSYNLPFVLEMVGELDISELEAIFKQLINRHESLRTSFELIKGQGVQRVHESVDFRVNLVQARTEEIPVLLNRMLKPFDLTVAPLMRVGLLQVNPKHHILMVDLHHIISDGVSTGILIKEFMALSAKKELPPLRIQYKDYAEWQNQLDKEVTSALVLQKDETYWLDELGDDLPVLNLPLDFPRPTVQTFGGKHLYFTLGKEVTKGLKELTVQTDATLYMTLLAVYNVLLARISGDEDIIVGTPIAGRSHADLRPIIGMFVNTLAIRNQPVGAKGFKEFLTEVKAKTLQAFEHQNYPFEDLVKQVEVRRDVSRNPIFDAMLLLQNMDIPEMEISGLRIKPYQFENNISRFDLGFLITEEAESLSFMVEYNTQLFKEETIQRWSRMYEKIVQEVINNPEIPIYQIQLIEEAESKRLLEEFNQTTVTYPAQKGLHQLFEDQVVRVGARDALIYEEIKVSYHELNRRANQLAHRLVLQGVQPESVVAVLTERSVEMIVALFGVLKAGGTYLPIDPTYPKERISYMLRDSKAQIILTNLELPADLTESYSGLVINLGDQSLVTYGEANLNLDFDPHSLAYIIYTSGSTGRPKGVMIEHKSVVNTLYWRANYYGFTENDVALQFLSFAFDGSVTDIFTPLISGATLVLLPEERRLDIGYIREMITRQQITRLLMVPNFYKAVLATGNNTQLSGLKSVTVAGESCSQELVKLHFEQLPNVRLVNEYGPTENSVCSTVFEFTKEQSEVLIGKPINNVQCYILNKYNEIQPIGTPGEICLSGVGLARGYLNQPELTLTQFRPGSWDSKICLYHTGDQGRWLADGNIAFQGRSDEQVKIRGYRIELTEIENQFKQLPGILEVVVTTRTEEAHTYLCAYYVADQELTVSDIRIELSKVLPEYMIPAYYHQMTALPVSASGKVDKRALPSLAGLRPNLTATYVEPKSNLEKLIAECFKQTLKIEQIGIHDNFFELGSNSFDIIQISSQLQTELQQNISVVTMFRYPTIHSLAQFLHTGDVVQNDRVEVMDKAKKTMTQSFKRMRGGLGGTNQRK